VNDQAFDHWHEHGMVALGYINDRLAEIEEKKLSFNQHCALVAMRVLGPIVDGDEIGIYDPIKCRHDYSFWCGNVFDLADAMEEEYIRRAVEKRIKAEEALAKETPDVRSE
jgi:hypothetical protein